jgi:hypothetical protein
MTNLNPQDQTANNSLLIGSIVGGSVGLLLIVALIAFIAVRTRRAKKTSQEPAVIVSPSEPPSTLESHYGPIDIRDAHAHAQYDIVPNSSVPHHHYDSVSSKLN